jgi:hypothetical protein
MLALLRILFSLPHVNFIIIQNPPGTPAALASRILSHFTNAKICIDWHNLGFTLYLDRYSTTHPLVRISKYLEGALCAPCHYHICVSSAMSKWLGDNYGVQAHVFYDRPPKAVFSRMMLKVQRENEMTNEEGKPKEPGQEAKKEEINEVRRELTSPPSVSLEDRHRLLMKLNLTEKALFPHRQTLTASNSRDHGSGYKSGSVTPPALSPKPSVFNTPSVHHHCLLVLKLPKYAVRRPLQMASRSIIRNEPFKHTAYQLLLFAQSTKH